MSIHIFKAMLQVKTCFKKRYITIKVKKVLKPILQLSYAEEGMQQGKYIERIDTTQSDLNHFQDFLYKHFKRSEHYDQMRPVSNQPGRFFATAKTQKFTSLNDITVENLKLRPIIDLTGTYTYNTSKVIANYLRPLSKNQYTISDTLKFLNLPKSADPNANYKDVSYDVESLFISIPVAETIEYILKHIHQQRIKTFM